MGDRTCVAQVDVGYEPCTTLNPSPLNNALDTTLFGAFKPPGRSQSGLVAFGVRGAHAGR